MYQYTYQYIHTQTHARTHIQMSQHENKPTRKRKQTQKYTNAHVHAPFKHIYKIRENTIYFSEFHDESFDDYNVIARDYPILKIGYPNEHRYWGGTNPRVTLTKHLTHFNSGYWFRRPVNLTKYLTHLIFSKYFSQQIVLTKYLILLTVREYFSKPISLNKRLRHLEIKADHYNQRIDLTKNIITAVFDHCFNQHVVLPKYIVRITFGDFFAQPIVLTKYLREITIDKCPFIEYPLDSLVLLGKHTLNNLPNGIKCIKTSCYYRRPMRNLPNTLVNIIHRSKYDNPTFEVMAKSYVKYNSMIYKERC